MQFSTENWSLLFLFNFDVGENRKGKIVKILVIKKAITVGKIFVIFNQQANIS